MHSAVLIIPAEHIAAINALGAVQGWGSDNYTIPLAASDDKALTVTHYAARVDVSPAFVAETAAAKAGQLPPVDWSALGTTASAVQAALDALVVSLDPVPGEAVIHGDPRAHLDAALAAQGLGEALQRVVEL